MNIESMDTPDTREEFEHRFHFVQELIRTKKFSPPLGIGLELVRVLPNGRIDLLSINESARLTANSMTNLAGRFKDITSQANADEPEAE